MVLIVPLAGVKIVGEVKGFEDVNDVGDRVIRNFCPNCGSPIYTTSVNGDKAGVVFVKTGLLDTPMPAPTLEIFARTRQAWLPEFPSVEHSFSAAAD